MIVYICSRYSAKNKSVIEKNIRIAKRYAKLAVKEGHTVICPHTNFAFLTERQRHIILEQCYELVKICDEIWVVRQEGKLSIGQQLELDVAVDKNKKIKFFDYKRRQR